MKLRFDQHIRAALIRTGTADLGDARFRLIAGSRGN
jgi:hypothetical protein